MSDYTIISGSKSLQAYIKKRYYRDLSKRELEVACYIISMMKESNKWSAFPSVERIANEFECSKRTIEYAITSLIRAGLFIRQRRADVKIIKGERVNVPTSAMTYFNWSNYPDLLRKSAISHTENSAIGSKKLKAVSVDKQGVNRNKLRMTLADDPCGYISKDYLTQKNNISCFKEQERAVDKSTSKLVSDVSGNAFKFDRDGYVIIPEGLSEGQKHLWKGDAHAKGQRVKWEFSKEGARAVLARGLIGKEQNKVG